MIEKVFLTDATGLIGKETIVPLLDAGFEIFALTTRKKSYSDSVN
jgi:nucleoside-diphosphate-sugar epimerase